MSLWINPIGWWKPSQMGQSRQRGRERLLFYKGEATLGDLLQLGSLARNEDVVLLADTIQALGNSERLGRSHLGRTGGKLELGQRTHSPLMF